MKITGTGPIQTSVVRRKSQPGRAAGAGFAGALASDGAVRGAAAPAEVAPASALLAAQEVDDPLVGRSQAVRRGEDILERLDEIRHGLLIGSIPRERLNQLLAIVRRQQGRVSDPRLREVLAEIELRASVELAKLGRLG